MLATSVPLRPSEGVWMLCANWAACKYFVQSPDAKAASICCWANVCWDCAVCSLNCWPPIVEAFCNRCCWSCRDVRPRSRAVISRPSPKPPGATLPALANAARMIWFWVSASNLPPRSSCCWALETAELSSDGFIEESPVRDLLSRALICSVYWSGWSLASRSLIDVF